jgi:DNA-binding MurR/RpiR family transcriptional regulator
MLPPADEPVRLANKLSPKMAITLVPLTDPPEDNHHLKRLIASGQLTFPCQLERVARVALSCPELVAFDSAKTFASKCGVSPTSVVRFARHLGFNSFREMKVLFQRRLKELADGCFVRRPLQGATMIAVP